MQNDKKKCIVNPIVDPNNPCQWKLAETEYLENYPKPIRRESKISRKSNMNAFLWHEISMAYIKSQRQTNIIENNQIHSSEYVYEFHKIPLDHSKADDAVQKSYPLYGTQAISYWCPIIRTKSPFKQTHSMTKINDECYDAQYR